MWKFQNDNRGFELNAFIRHFHLEPCGTCHLECGMWNRHGALKASWNPRTAEPWRTSTLCASFVGPGTFEPWGTWTLKTGTFIRNLAETGSGFQAATPNHPETLLAGTPIFQIVGEKWVIFLKGHSAPEISTVPKFFFFRLPPPVRWNLYVEPFKSGTFMRNLVEPQLLRVQSLSGTLWNFNRTFMWNLVEPQLLTVEPLCGTWWNLSFSDETLMFTQLSNTLRHSTRKCTFALFSSDCLNVK